MNILTYNLCLKPIVFELLKNYLKEKPKLLYSIDFKESKDYYSENFEDYIFCDQKNSKKGLDFNKKKFDFFLNKKIINDFSSFENLVYRIMSRYDRNEYTFDFHSRKSHYFDLLKYAFGLIEKYKIDKLIFFDYPHHMESIILYKVAKYMNIDVKIVSYLFIGEHRLIVDTSLEARFEDFKNSSSLYSFNDKNLDYYNKIKDNFKHQKPFYVSENGNLLYAFYFLIKDLYRSLRNGLFKESNNFVKTSKLKKMQDNYFPTEIISSFLMFFNRLKILKLKKIYNKISIKKPNLDENYILFCPNLQPEASTMPLAGIYSDYEIIIDTVLKVLPKNWNIYFKEHPLVFNLLKESYLIKNKNYYKNLSNPKIKFIDYKYDTFDLIDNSNFVITPTGSIGLESMIRGKNVGFFGTPWWHSFKDATYIENSSDIFKLININLTKCKIENKNFIDDYKKTFKNSFPWLGYNYDNYNMLKRDIDKNKLDIKILSIMKKFLISKIEKN